MSGVRVKVRRTPNTGPPSDIEFGELTFSEADETLHVGKSDGTAKSLPLVGGEVQSVNGQTGDVTLDAESVGADAAGVGANLLTSHVSDPTPHSQYDAALAEHDAEILANQNAISALSGGQLTVAIAQITGTWSTTSTAYTQLGGGNFKFTISAKAGDRILVYPPSVSWSVIARFKLQRNGIDILLGDDIAGKDQATWGPSFSGGVSQGGTHYYGCFPIGGPLVDVVDADGDFEYSIFCKVDSGSLHLGRSAHDSGTHQARSISQFYGVNLGH
ncbi:MAG: hypothetical protein AAF215_31535 [Cyanobacteria bacterium P01_A01_bin.123]